MCVADQDKSALPVARDELLAQGMRTGATIDDDKRSSCRAYLDTCGIAAVASGARARSGYRAASTPELNAHVIPSKPMDPGFPTEPIWRLSRCTISPREATHSPFR